MIRINYIIHDKTKTTAFVYNYIAQKVFVTILKNDVGFKTYLSCPEMNKDLKFNLKSLQNTKRKIRKLLKNEFNVNLQDEVRNVLCG